jgi:hypothetical protein
VATPLETSVFVVEGEEDALFLEALGLVATTNVGGAGRGKWLRDYNAFFRDRQVVVLADNDEPGYQHRQGIVRNLLSLAAGVKAPDLPGLHHKGDVRDWIRDCGHTRDELLEIVAKTPPETPTEVFVGEPGGDDPDDEGVVLGTVPEFPIDSLPVAAQPMVRESPLPKNMLANSNVSAVMATIGGEAEIAAANHWVERPIEFFGCLAPPTTAKSAAIRRPYEELEAHNTELRNDYESKLAKWRKLPPKDRLLIPRPVDGSFIRSKVTVQAATRQLYRQPSTVFVVDELSIQLREMRRNQADDRGGGDQGYYLELWDGAIIRYERVSGSETVDNGIDIVVQRPTVVLVGGLQTTLNELLGTDEDGLRARWMLSIDANLPRVPLVDSSSAADQLYADLIAMLLKRRAIRRRWVMDAQVHRAFEELRAIWQQAATEADLPLGVLERSARSRTRRSTSISARRAGAPWPARRFPPHCRTGSPTRSSIAVGFRISSGRAACRRTFCGRTTLAGSARKRISTSW